MNEIIRTLTNHRSYRSYSDRAVSTEDLQNIIASAQAAPSWVHGQQFTIIAVHNQERKQRLAELSGNQKHVAEAPVFLVFCMDFYRAGLASEMEGQPFEAASDVDALLVGAADVGLAMAGAITAAESLGLGTIPIGGVRRNTKAVIELLQLPKYVFPIAGLCVGYPGAESPKKSRLPMEAVYHEEQYNTDQTGLLQAYNETHRQSLQQQGLPERSWTSWVAHFYANNAVYGDARNTLKEQGFMYDKERGE
ncbi:NADPH-dependent oxidoreductase [Paenibacillus sp. GCM10012306]|uniref:NADPH-dependent oxidoreductase n=1 Tax=Paenibacillus sp. GCM10012306 TaxID=3317342 RepID=UPI003618F793